MNHFANRIPAARLMFAVLLCVALICGCVRPDPVAVSPAPTGTPVETIEIVTPSPAPLDLSPCRITDEGIYDLLPLVSEPDRTLLHAGFAERGTLLLLFCDKACTTLTWEHFDLLTGDRTALRTEPAPDAFLYPERFRFYASNPPLYFDEHDGTLFAMSPDFASVRQIDTTGLSFDTARRVGDDILLFDGTLRRLVRITPDGAITPVFEAGWRYRYAELLSVTADGRFAALDTMDAYRDERVTVLIDLSTGAVAGQQTGSLHLCADGGRYATMSVEYGTDDCSDRATLTTSYADAPDAAWSFRASTTHENEYPTVFDAPGGFCAEVWGAKYSLLYRDAAGGGEWTATVPTERYAEAVKALRALQPTPDPAWGDEPMGEEGTELFPTVFADCCDGERMLASITFDAEPVALLLWDISEGTRAVPDGMSFEEPLFAPQPFVDTTPARYADRVAALEAEYGITVLIGDAATVAVASYRADTVSIEENLHEIDFAMDTLESVVREFPAGFFRDVRDGSGDALVFELCGAIHPTDDTAIETPAALTYHTEGSRVIVLNVFFQSGMRYTLFHEISHLIDHHLDAVAWETDAWSMDGWNALNPKRFSYYESYLDEQGRPYEDTGSLEYTPLHRNYEKKHKRDSVYFLDRYSKTFATEDRAVLFGTLLESDLNDEALSCPNVWKKLDYYSRAIRAVMDPDGTKWTEPTAWERRIESLQDRD